MQPHRTNLDADAYAPAESAALERLRLVIIPLARMRLTLLNQFYPPDVAPTGQLAASIAEHRAALGDEVTVLTSRGGYVARSSNADTQRADTARAKRGSVDIRRIWTPQLGKRFLLGRLLDYAVFYWSAIWRLALLPRQDVIVSLTTPPYIAWAAIMHKLIHGRTKVVLWNMDCYPDVAERSGVIRRGGLFSRFLRCVNRVMLRQVDHLVCLDAAMMDLLQSQYTSTNSNGQTRPAASVIPNWENLALFPAAAPLATRPDAEALGLDGNFVVLYLGNTGVGHAFETVLDAAEAMNETGDAVRFLFVGGGSRWEEIRREKERRNLANVILRGYIPKGQTPAAMAAADAALVTLRDEALGVMSPSKLHSNLAMGLPVIYVGPPKSNVDEAVVRFGCGVSLRHGDVQGLVEFIRRLISDAPLRSDLRSRARRAFDEAYCDARTLPQFDRLLESIKTPAGRRGF